MKPNQKRIDRGLYWDRALSLVEGCTKVSEGCRHCWSESQAAMRCHNPAVAYRYKPVISNGRWNGKIQLMHSDLKKPLSVKRPQVWSVWNDLFHDDVSYEFIIEAFSIMNHCDQHTFLVLTKRPHRMLEYCGEYGLTWPSNVWAGTTVESQEYDYRIGDLLKVPAAVRWLSIEPMLDKVSIPEFGINWVVCGTESIGGKPGRPVDIEHIINLKNQCVASGTAFYLKQMEIDGKLVKLPELDGRVWDQFPE